MTGSKHMAMVLAALLGSISAALPSTASGNTTIIETSTQESMSTCVVHVLEKRLHRPRHLIFGTIDMVVGFTRLTESLEVEFTLLVPTHGWLAFGVSEVGSMKGADIAVIEPRGDGTHRLTDRYSVDFVEPKIDKIQNWELLSASQETFQACGRQIPLTTAVVRRLLDTCDAEDEPLTPDFLQNYFIAAYGASHEKTMRYHRHRASIAEYVHVPEPMIPKKARGGARDILTPPMQVPAGMTSYCYTRVHITEELSVTGYVAVNVRHVHHIGLFKAAAISFQGDYQCTDDFDGMGTPQLQWAVGTKEIIFPSGLYIKLEPGEYYFEVHFENPTWQAFNTTAGLRVWGLTPGDHVDKLEERDEIQILNLESRWSGALQAGPQAGGHFGLPAGAHALQARQRRHLVEGNFELPTGCLHGLPVPGVSIMVTVAHMHRRGHQMHMYRTRGDRTELVFEQRAYDINKQNPVWKPWTLMPGDKIVWRCTWNTSGDSESVTWGLKAHDEMCSIFLAANKGTPFRYAGTGLSTNGTSYAYCSGSRPRFDNQAEIDMRLSAPPPGTAVIEVPREPAPHLFEERGRDRNLCHAMALAEVAAPANNWLPGGLFFFCALAFVLHASSQRGVQSWCKHFGIERTRPWMAARAINIMETWMCATVIILVLSRFDEHFRVETTDIYEFVGDRAFGRRYDLLNTAGDFVAATYMMVFAVKATHQLPMLGDMAHHGSSLLCIFMLRNALEYEYAPSLLCFFAASMLLHSAASGPMYLTFVLLKLNPRPRHNRKFAVAFMAASAVKQCIMLIAHVANIWNYTLFFSAETFYLREVSTAEWNSDPYFQKRLHMRDLWLGFPWMETLVYLLPLLWAVLCAAQFYNTYLQFKIGLYEFRKGRGLSGGKEGGKQKAAEEGLPPYVEVARLYGRGISTASVAA